MVFYWKIYQNKSPIIISTGLLSLLILYLSFSFWWVVKLMNVFYTYFSFDPWAISLRTCWSQYYPICMTGYFNCKDVLSWKIEVINQLIVYSSSHNLPIFCPKNTAPSEISNAMHKYLIFFFNILDLFLQSFYGWQISQPCNREWQFS